MRTRVLAGACVFLFVACGGDDALNPHVVEEGSGGTGGDCPPVCHMPPGGPETDEFICGEKSLELQLAIDQVILVLDFSGSMTKPWDHDFNPATPDSTRWYALHGVVESILEEHQDEVEFGLVMFPSDGDECSVASTPDVPPALGNKSEILAAMPDADSPWREGGTPAAVALTTAINGTLAAGAEEGGAVALITDGLPSCEDDIPAMVDVATTGYQEHGVRSFVVGVGVTNGSAAAMDAVAEAGGTANFYNSADEDELESIAESVIGQAASCRVPLDPIPEFPDELKIYLDGDEVPQVADCAQQSGWSYEGSQHDEIRLCGSYCDGIAAGVTELVADYACPSLPPA